MQQKYLPKLGISLCLLGGKILICTFFRDLYCQAADEEHQVRTRFVPELLDAAGVLAKPSGN